LIKIKSINKNITAYEKICIFMGVLISGSSDSLLCNYIVHSLFRLVLTFGHSLLFHDY
jgi:hypothetical protein